MSLTKRTWTTPIVKSHTLTFTGSVSGATTKLTMVFQAASAIYGIRGTINVYVNGTKQSCTWTTNKTETLVNTKYKTKMTSAQITISKPFFTLKLTDSNDNEAFYEETFSFYEIEKTPTAATCSGGVMDGTTKSKVTFTTSGTDATYKATFTLGSYSGSATSTTKELQYAIPIAWCNAVPNATTGKANVVCQVLYGGVVYSSISTTMTVSVPASVVPTLTAITLADKTNTPVMESVHSAPERGASFGGHDSRGVQFHDKNNKAAGWNAVGIKGLFRICSSADRYHHPERITHLHGHSNGQQGSHGKQDGYGDLCGIFCAEVHQVHKRKGNLRRRT